MGLLKKLLRFLVFLAMLGMVVSVTWQIFTRYILDDPNIWTEEATRIFLVYMTFLGSGLVMLRGDEVKVTILTDRLSTKAQTVLSLSMTFLSMIFLAVLFWYTFPLMKRLAHQPLPALRFSKSYVYLSLALGSLSMFLGLVERVLNSFKKIVGHHEKEEDT